MLMDVGYSVAWDANGDVVVAGYFTGGVSWGLLENVFVAKYSGASGSELWSRIIGGSSSDFGRSVAFDTNNDVLLTGSFRSSVWFGAIDPQYGSPGPPVLSSSGQDDVLVMKLSGGDGSTLWVGQLGGSGSDQGRVIAADALGNVFVAGSFQGTVNFGNGPVTSVGSDDGFLAKLSGVDGSSIWSLQFGGLDSDRASHLAVTGSSDVILTEIVGSEVHLGKVSGANGSPDWTRNLGLADTFTGHPVAVDLNGDVFIARLPGALVAKTSGADGTSMWLVNGTALVASSVQVDGNGNVLVVGDFWEATAIVDGVLLPNLGQSDVFAASFSGVDGSYRWSRRFGGSGNEHSIGAVVDGNGDAFLTGWFGGTADLGAGVHTSAGQSDILVLKFRGR